MEWVIDANNGREFNYVLNHARFIHEIRCKEIRKCIRGKLGLFASKIINAMMLQSNRIQRSSEIKCTEPLTIEMIMRLYK